jgi:hypothetical protein
VLPGGKYPPGCKHARPGGWGGGGGGGVSLEKVSRFRKRRRDIPLGTWNIRSLCRAGSLMTVATELARYKLDLVGVQEVRWDK